MATTTYRIIEDQAGRTVSKGENGGGLSEEAALAGVVERNAEAEGIAGPEDGWTVERVYGAIRMTGDGERVFFSEDDQEDDVDLWAVSSGS